jgi:small subunit ribosomal protein S20
MPIKQNAKKALRQAKRRADINAIFRDAYKEAVKNLRKAAAAGQETKELLRLAQKKLDKAAQRGVIKRNTAARKISRLASAASKKTTAAKK